MGTETIIKTMEQMQETFQSTADLYTKASLSILEAYNKQLATSAEWHKHFVKSTFNSGFTKNSEVASDILKKNAETYQKTFTETIRLSKDVTEKILNAWKEQDSFSPVSEEVTDAVFNIFRKQAEVITDSGEQFLNTLKEYKPEDYYKQFDNFLNDTVKSSEKSIENLIEVYNQKAEFTKKATEQLTGNIAKQFDALTEVSSKFFNDLLKSFDTKKKTNGKTNINAATQNTPEKIDLEQLRADAKKYKIRGYGLILTKNPQLLKKKIDDARKI